MMPNIILNNHYKTLEVKYVYASETELSQMEYQE